jgi:hypothetical protein
MTKRNTPSEQRKRRLACGRRRNHTTAIEAIDPKYKGLVKQKMYNPPSIDHEQYDKLGALLMQEEESTCRESDDVLPGTGFVRRMDKKSRVDENNLRNAITRLSVVAEATDVAETAPSQATTGGAFTEEADQYFALHAYSEFAEANLTSFGQNRSSI